MIALLALSCVFAFSPVFNIYVYATLSESTTMNNYTEYLSAVHIPNTTVDATSDDQFLIPYLSASGLVSTGTQYYIHVVSPAGQTHTLSVTSGNETNAASGSSYFSNTEVSGTDYLTLNALNNGTYSIVYQIGDYYSSTYTITVTNVSYSLDFTDPNTGLTSLIASNYKTKTKLTLPTPYIVNANAEKGDDDYYIMSSTNSADYATYDMESYVTVTYNGAVQTLNDEYEIDNGDNTTTSYKLYYSDTDSETNTTYYYVDFQLEGKYTIEYSYPYGSNPQTVTYTIEVSDSFVAPTSADLTITTPTMPTMELGQSITLPSLTLSDNLTSNADYNITKITIVNSADSTIYTELYNNTLDFDFTIDQFDDFNANITSYTQLAGSYYITYYIEDAYGNTKSITLTVNNITDSTVPEVYMAYAYTVNEDNDGVKTVVTDEDGNDDVDINYAVDLKDTYGYGELIFPAIYATDAVTSYDEFTFIRYIQNTSTKTIYYLDNLMYEDNQVVEVEPGDTGYNWAYYVTDSSNTDDDSTKTYYGTTTATKANEFVNFQFTRTGGEDDAEYAGTYELGYYVVCKTVTSQENYVYSSGTTKYSFTITSISNSSVDSTPTVEFNNLDAKKSYSVSDSISVNITAEDTVDTRLKTIVFLYTSTTRQNDLEADIKTAIGSSRYASDMTSNILDSSAFSTAMTTAGYSNFTICEIDEGSASTYIIDLSYLKDVSGVDSVYVVALTMNDGLNIGTATKTLTLKDTTESDAPTASISAGGDLFYSSSIAETLYGNNSGKDGYLVVGKYTYDDSGDLTGIDTTTYSSYTMLIVDQASTVTLPTVSFSDADTSLALSVYYYIGTPESDTGFSYLSPSGKKFSSNTITGGTIKTSKVGTYYVIYTATDDAGNSTIMFFCFYVADSSDPILVVSATADDSASTTSSTISGEKGTTISFDVTLYSSDKSSDLTDETETDIDCDVSDGGLGLDWSPTGDGEYVYVFNDVGTYTVTFTASYNGRSAVDKVFTITISLPDLEWDDDITVSEYAGLDEKVVLPYATATQGSTAAVVTVSVTDPNGDEWTTLADTSKAFTDEVSTDVTYQSGNYVLLQVENEVLVWAFYTNSTTKGDYTVTYTATTADSTISQEFTIKVGDNVAPTITISYEDELSQDLTYDGTQIEYIIDYNTSTSSSKRHLIIKVTCDGETIYEYDTGLTVKDTDDSGTTTTITNWATYVTVELTCDDDDIYTVDDDGYTYYITGTGTFSLVITASDSYGNTSTKTVSFNVVSSETEDNSISDTTIGVILIVVSLLVLAGVILFFTFTGKGGTTTKSKKVKSSKAKEISSSADSVAADTDTSAAAEGSDAKAEAEQAGQSDDASDAKSGEVE